jgi:hypothetical protein
VAKLSDMTSPMFTLLSFSKEDDEGWKSLIPETNVAKLSNMTFSEQNQNWDYFTLNRMRQLQWEIRQVRMTWDATNSSFRSQSSSVGRLWQEISWWGTTKYIVKKLCDSVLWSTLLYFATRLQMLCVSKSFKMAIQICGYPHVSQEKVPRDRLKLRIIALNQLLCRHYN